MGERDVSHLVYHKSLESSQEGDVDTRLKHILLEDSLRVNTYYPQGIAQPIGEVALIISTIDAGKDVWWLTGVHFSHEEVEQVVQYMHKIHGSFHIKPEKFASKEDLDDSIKRRVSRLLYDSFHEIPIEYLRTLLKEDLDERNVSYHNTTDRELFTSQSGKEALAKYLPLLRFIKDLAATDPDMLRLAKEYRQFLRNNSPQDFDAKEKSRLFLNLLKRKCKEKFGNVYTKREYSFAIRNFD